MKSHCASKMVVGSKRQGEELEEDSNVRRKHVKMRDLQSILHCQGLDTPETETSRLEESEEHINIVETQSSQVLDKNASHNVEERQFVGGLQNRSTIYIDRRCSIPLDLNTEVCTDENSGYNDVCLGDSKEQFLYAKSNSMIENRHMALGTNRVDLNAEDVASSENYGFFRSLKMKDSSDSGKPTNRSDNQDSLKKWKEMKKNGFMSSAYGYGGIPAAPKPRGRKSKTDVLKHKKEQAKMEQAKKEQVDRFTKMAAPSGLLNGLNPGIINHVRNSKQVHSIIQALVRSEKKEISRQAKLAERNAEQKKANFYTEHGSDVSYISSMSLIPESNSLRQNQFSHCSSLYSSDDGTEFRDSIVDESGCPHPSLFPFFKIQSEDDALALKLASPTKVSNSTSCVSIEDPADDTSVDTLSVKAATVASQWLQLLHQDIKGRLAALRRSKKRVQAVITTELPSLLSKEFRSNHENDPYALKDSAYGYPNTAKAESHKAHWSKLFNQMECTLTEEEKQLESWLNQVNKMMLHCDQGLQHIQLNSILEMQHLGNVDISLRSRFNDPEKELSVRAAAASVYSTCNFLSSREDVSCC